MKIVTLFIFLFIANIVFAQKNNIDRAYKFYVNQQYDSALTIYENLETENLISADLFYNMGNCYYKLKKTGLAILYYERSLKQEPWHKESLQNLNLCKSKLVDKDETIAPFVVEKIFNDLANTLSMNTWAFVIIVCLLSLLFTLYYFKYYFRNAVMLFLIGFLSIVLLFSFISANLQYNIKNNNLNVIIIDAVVAVKNGPTEQSQDIVSIHEGYKTSIVQELDNWINIKLSNGNTGWVLKSSLAII